MKELRCPNCNQVFKVDEASYASIVSQVKNSEFEQELARRLSELKDKELAEREATLLKEKEKWSTEQEERERQFRKEKEDWSKSLSTKESELSKQREEISQLKSELKGFEVKKELDLKTELEAKEKELAELRNDLKLQKKEAEMSLEKLKSDQVNALLKEKGEAERQKQELTQKHEIEMKNLTEEVERLKDYKARLSTKMIGESLEEHCSTEYNSNLRSLLPSAYFEKDNDSSGGSKGDFIFRDYIDGVEYISIMFEMKNEADTTATKQKNEDFLKKLDSDRNEKKCEYAVLVSLLEPESELYNRGIVDVSYKYPKMYVIRPQFFLPIITLLRQAAQNSAAYKKELEVARNQSIDVSRFEEKLWEFKDNVGNNYRLAKEHFEDATNRIDTIISSLEKLKESFRLSERQLGILNGKVEDLTIRKLTKDNPTMKAEFERVRKARTLPAGEEETEK